MKVVPVEEYRGNLVNTYFATDCPKDVETLKEWTDEDYDAVYGRSPGWELDRPFTEEDEQWVLDTITKEEGE